MFEFLKKIFSSAERPDLTDFINKKAFLVDVRTPGEYAQGHPKGSVNIPLDKITANIDKFKGKRDIIVFCRSGNRSSQAKSILEAKGFKNIIDGGTWDYVAQYTG